jgi:hypothetical protein
MPEDRDVDVTAMAEYAMFAAEFTSILGELDRMAGLGARVAARGHDPLRRLIRSSPLPISIFISLGRLVELSASSTFSR